jgi:hypothetical protein
MSTGLFAYNYEGQLKDQFSVLHTYDYFIVLDYNITLHVAGSLVVLRDNKMSMYGVYGVLPRNKLTEYQYPCHLKLHEGMNINFHQSALLSLPSFSPHPLARYSDHSPCLVSCFPTSYSLPFS